MANHKVMRKPLTLLSQQRDSILQTRNWCHILFFLFYVLYIWYSNLPSNKIVGEWQREVRGGTDIEIFKSDGTWESITKFPGDHRDYRTNGTWEMFKGKTLVKTFWSNDEGRYLSDTYEVINISSDELVFNTRMKIEKGILDKAYKWFPTFKQVLTLERECKEYGFNEEQTDKLVHGKPIQYNGWLHSNEYRRNALATNVAAQIVRDAKTLVLQINDTSISQWFRVQFGIGQEQHRELKP